MKKIDRYAWPTLCHAAVFRVRSDRQLSPPLLFSLSHPLSLSLSSDLSIYNFFFTYLCSPSSFLSLPFSLPDSPLPFWFSSSLNLSLSHHSSHPIRSLCIASFCCGFCTQPSSSGVLSQPMDPQERSGPALEQFVGAGRPANRSNIGPLLTAASQGEASRSLIRWWWR